MEGEFKDWNAIDWSRRSIYIREEWSAEGNCWERKMRAEVHPLHVTKGGHNKVGKRISVECCRLKTDCSGLRVEYVMRMKSQEAETQSFKRSERLSKEGCCGRRWTGECEF